MYKILCLINARQHFWNRIKLRKGNWIYFFLAKKIDSRNNADEICYFWKYRNHIYITQGNKLQTYIKTLA